MGQPLEQFSIRVVSFNVEKNLLPYFLNNWSEFRILHLISVPFFRLLQVSPNEEFQGLDSIVTFKEGRIVQLSLISSEEEITSQIKPNKIFFRSSLVKENLTFLAELPQKWFYKSVHSTDKTLVSLAFSRYKTGLKLCCANFWNLIVGVVRIEL